MLLGENQVEWDLKASDHIPLSDLDQMISLPPKNEISKFDLLEIKYKKYQSFAYLKVHDVSGRCLIQFSPTLNSLERELYRRDAKLTWCCFLNLTQFLQFLTDFGNFEKL